MKEGRGNEYRNLYRVRGSRGTDLDRARASYEAIVCQHHRRYDSLLGSPRRYFANDRYNGNKNKAVFIHIEYSSIFKIFLILFLRYQIRRYGSINYLETVIGSIYSPSFPPSEWDSRDDRSKIGRERERKENREK